MENPINANEQNLQEIKQNPGGLTSQPMNKNKTNYMVIITVIVACSVIFGIMGYLLGQKYKTTNKSANSIGNNVPLTTQPNNESGLNMTNLEFIKKLESIYTFSGSENVRKRVVIFREIDQQEEATVYLTNETFDKSSLVKIATIGHSETEFGYSQDVGRKFFYLFLHGPGDFQEIILADENGTVVATDVIARNAKKIGLGTTIKPQYGIRVRGAWIIDNIASIAVVIDNAYDEEYEVMINGYTGDYIEGSLKKLK